MAFYKATLIVSNGNSNRVKFTNIDKTKLKLKEDPIVPSTAYTFDKTKATHGMVVSVEYENGAIKSVISETLPPLNKEKAIEVANLDINEKFAEQQKQVQQEAANNSSKNSPYRPNNSTYSNKSGQASFNGGGGKSLGNVEPSALGSAFVNPYTFIPFPTATKTVNLVPNTIGESEKDRISGVIQVKLRTETPLLTHEADPCNCPRDAKDKHKEYKALKIGNDVIVPATAVKGFVRYLATIVSASAISHVDPYAQLCQGRDLQFHAGKATVAGTKKGELVKIIKVGDSKKDGLVQEGETRFAPRKLLARYSNQYVTFNSNGDITKSSKNDPNAYLIKVSGEPIKPLKSEAGFRHYNKEPIKVHREIWAKYNYIHRNADKDISELKEGKLVWVERDDKGNIISLQAARWGRKGVAMLDENILRLNYQPDWVRGDGKYSPVTNLFGIADFENASDKKKVKLPKFASRLKFGNLIFKNAKTTEKIALSPLGSPHPGCISFYRTTPSKSSPLRGVKAYRAINDVDKKPWKFETQPILNENGKIDREKEKSPVNSSAELLREDAIGVLNIAFVNLNKAELSLMLKLCELPWRLGGGKPFGLGYIKVEECKVYDENAKELKKEDYQENSLIDSKQLSYWVTSQQKMNNVRYPMAIELKDGKYSGGGHQWFAKLSAIKRDQSQTGLIPLNLKASSYSKVGGEIKGQSLPLLTDKDPHLYGYRLVFKSLGKDLNNKAAYSIEKPID